MKKYIKVKHNCPYCGKLLSTLTTYHIMGSSEFYFVGDTIINIRAEDAEHQSFLSAIGYCDKCDKEFRAEVGIDNYKLTDLIVTKK